MAVILALEKFDQMTERELVLDGWIDEIFNDPDEIYRANAINAAMMRAKDLDCVDALKRRIAAYKKQSGRCSGKT